MSEKILLYIDRRGKMVAIEACGKYAEMDEYSCFGLEEQCLAWDDLLDCPPKELPGFFIWEGRTTDTTNWQESYFSEGFDYVGEYRPATRSEVEKSLWGGGLWQKKLKPDLEIQESPVLENSDFFK